MAAGGLVLTGLDTGGKVGPLGWLARVDAWGNPIWSRLGDPAPNATFAAIAALPDGGLVIAGNSAGNLLLERRTRWGFASCQVAGTCLGVAVDGCDDGLSCTADDCQPGTGCVHPSLVQGWACADGAACTPPWICTGTSCAPGPVKDCNDGDPCTVDACVGTACGHVPAADGESCAGGKVCKAGLCS